MIKKTILTIGGGEAYENLLDRDFIKSRLDFIKKEINFDPYAKRQKNWKANLQEDLGEDYQVIKMMTPNESCAVYEEWKYAFEKTLSYIEGEVSLVGHSLGAIFILKWLLENSKTGPLYNKPSILNSFSQGEKEAADKIDSVFLVGTPLTDSLQEVLGTFGITKEVEMFLGNTLSNRQKNMYFYASVDDTIVDFQDFLEYKKIFPKANFREFEDRGHFSSQQQFLELLEDIKSS